MGAIADALVAYAQPLIDQTDGSLEQMNKAFSLGSACYNLALLPKANRDAAIAKMQPTLQMDDDEFAAFRRTVIEPMILRHEEMFPRMHGKDAFQLPSFEPTYQIPPATPTRKEKYPGIGPYSPCPCNSGKKYKFCCRK